MPENVALAVADSGSFRKGVIANPAGRPPGRSPSAMIVYDLKQAARSYAAKSIEVIAACLDHKDAKVRLLAATIMLERAYGRPEVKGRIRQMQQQMLRRRMMHKVPTADVVLVNPTHFAVALSYDAKKVAPEVIAKGQDLVAAQIRRIAEENNVPIVPDPPLARALHGSVEVGQLVPEEMWAAVAQLLAFVYRAAARRRVA